MEVPVNPSLYAAPTHNAVPWVVAGVAWCVFFIGTLFLLPQNLWKLGKDFVARQYLHSDYILVQDQQIINGNIIIREARVSKPVVFGLSVRGATDEFPVDTPFKPTDVYPAGVYKNLPIEVDYDLLISRDNNFSLEPFFFVSAYYQSSDTRMLDAVVRDSYGNPVIDKIKIL